MNPGRGVFISQEPQNRDSWTPVTPGKPTPQRSGGEVQGNQQTEKENWQELVGMYSDLLQKVPGVDGLAEGFNPTAPSARIDGNQNKFMRVAVAHTNMNPHFNQTSSSHYLSNPLNVDGTAQDINLTAPVDRNGGNQKWVAGLTEKHPSLSQPTNSHTHSFGANPRNLDGAVQDFNLTARLSRKGGNQDHIVGITENNQSSNQTSMSQANTLHSKPMNLNGMSQNFNLKRLVGLGDKPPFFNQTESSVPQSFHANTMNFNGPVQGFNLNAPMVQNRINQNLLKGLAEKTQIFNQPTRSDTQYYHESTTNFDQGFNLNAPVSWNGDNQSHSVGLGDTNPCFNETTCSWTYSFPANIMNFNGGNQNQDSNFTASMGHNAGNQKWVVGMNEKSPRFNHTSSPDTQAFCTIPSTFDGANYNSIVTTPMDPNGGNQNRHAGRAKNQPSSNQTTSSHTHSFRAKAMNVDGMGQNFNLIGAVDLSAGTQNQVMHLAEKNLRLSGTAISHVNSFVEDPANCSELLDSLLGIKNPEASFASPVNGEQSKGDLVLNRTSSFSSTMNGAQHKSTPFKDSIGSFASLNSDLQVQSNWEGNQNQVSRPMKDVREYTPKQLSIDGFPVHYRSYYNLNSPPTSEADAASSITDPFQIAPITPKIGKHIEKQCQSEANYAPVEESSAREKERHGNLRVSIRSDNAENNIPNNALLHTIGESSSSVISTTQKEHNSFDEGDGQGIDLNKTPQQKTPKRRKHRPKVVIEGKPKRTPKAKAPGSASNESAQSVKRKYVRKKGLDNSETPQTNDGPQSVQKRKYVRKKDLDNNSKSHQPSGLAEVMASAAKFAAKSCRRQLNFDLECGESQNTTNNHQMEETEQEGNKGFNMNSNPQETEQARINSLFAPSAMRIGQQNGFVAGITSKALFPEENVPRTPITIAKDHALNVIARNLSMRNSIPGENSSWRNGYHQVSENVGCQADNTSCSNLDRTKVPQFDKDLPGFDERRGTKRRPGEQIYPDIVNSVDDTAFRYRKLSFPVEPCNSSRNYRPTYLDNHKKARTHNGFYAAISAEDNTGLEMRQTNLVYGNGSILKSLSPIEVANAVYMNADKCHPQPMVSPHNIQKHSVSSGMQQAQTDRMATKRSQDLIQVHEMSPLTAIVNRNSLPKEASTCDYLQDIASCCANVSEQMQTAKPSSSNQIRFPGHSKMLQQCRKDSMDGQEQTSAKARGVPKKQSFQLSIDEITNRMEDLKICGDNEQEQHALVPYKGDGSIIPYEPIKKRKPRPKVDLDPETDRLWRLLMGKEGIEGAEALDKDKEKWWKNEREIFRGRADSFIARMRLVQGDRRFSRWKGSVVDSVIGVFLTQNVSDHLSSSAFMSLAAKFPLKSTTPTEACCKNGAGACVLVEEPIQIVKPNGRKTQPSFNQRAFLSSESFDQMMHSISRPRGEYNRHNKISEEEIISSQDSFDSSILQTADEIRSSSGSNSEAEDQATGFEPNKNLGRNPKNLLGAEASMFNRFFNLENWNSQVDERPENMLHQSTDPEYNMQNLRMTKNCNIHLVEESGSGSGSQTLGVQFHGISGDESLYSFQLSASGITKACHTSNTTYKQNELPRQATIPGQYDFLTNHPTHLQNLQGGPHIGNTPHFIDNRQEERSETFQLEGASKLPLKNSETLARSNTRNTNEDRVSVVDKLSYIESTMAEVHSKEQKSSFSGAGTNISKSRKGAADVEKKRAFDWDSLRKQARPNGEIRERSKDAMDSMDYEAIRSADVKKISDAIRERGMNNMLADRMKDFLNRLVREHGSIDLEWLRDVPPDKAKEYLLSIRGLGLKSVECVRLLTLHHLAFPVDTNVGRIAVRLGWVPLQPLPESLQLHLLELYPVLETIQKYIWPRLCTLDQLTLYELHYHMITFGKVFCTKSKPNCNACPMRAECRHFASAFASARLVPPGPEEKSIVSSDVPIAADRNRPTMIINPMPQLLPAENPTMDRGFFERICEPIIEEPATPEPETNREISESDIEDNVWFEEDPEDIPTIKLNMEEFSMNLHNLMQDNTEDDMSKALVALNPEAASIPTPKLKNVSRLRTEHQVYELPDSHPLLEGLDKREPDDPSPYLLAIWTPGETSNSTQPPEGTCPAQATGKLCTKKTCVECNGIREADLQIVRGTLLIPCRTAMRGSFPLNGTYFQVNEMFADHESSVTPIDVPRSWIWNLPRRIVYFGTSVSTIFKGLTTEGIQYCFWRGFVCVRGFDRKTRAPRPLRARLHFPASKLVKTKNEGQ